MGSIRIEDMTREEFLGLLKKVFDVTDCEKTHDELIDRFEEHPNGSDLIFYPENPEDSTPERIVKIVEEWRASSGLSGFKR